MFVILSVKAQTDSLALYPNSVPGLKKNQITETVINDWILRVTNVKNPKLYVYQPPNGNPTGASVIICPGGAYGFLAIDVEGHQVAKWFAARGVTAFVLKYRLPQSELFEEAEIRPLQDVQQAFRIIRVNASKYQISNSKIGIIGFSAGGHLASTASTHFNNQVGEITDQSINVRPDFSILLYSVISFNEQLTHMGSRENLIGKNQLLSKIDEYSNDKHVKKDTPPAFLVCTTDDFVSPENSINYYLACKANKVPVELHIYEKGGHGYSMTKKNNAPIDSWNERLVDWMRNHEWMK